MPEGKKDVLVAIVIEIARGNAPRPERLQARPVGDLLELARYGSFLNSVLPKTTSL